MQNARGILPTQLLLPASKSSRNLPSFQPIPSSSYPTLSFLSLPPLSQPPHLRSKNQLLLLPPAPPDSCCRLLSVGILGPLALKSETPPPLSGLAIREPAPPKLKPSGPVWAARPRVEPILAASSRSLTAVSWASNLWDDSVSLNTLFREGVCASDKGKRKGGKKQTCDLRRLVFLDCRREGLLGLRCDRFLR